MAGALLGMMAVGSVHAMGSFETDKPDPEFSVCGFVREPLAFWTFRRAAGSPDSRRLAGLRGVEPIHFETLDKRRLGGYRLRASGNPRGYLLVAQGNAMLADQIMGELQVFRDRGFDVYVYDYRGYGLSAGSSRLNAIVSDYREIVAHLNRQDYSRRVLYGMSMGGIILLNAVGATSEYSALVVDSSPSRISHLGCPEQFDPANHLPADCSRLQLVIGERDRVVWPAEMEELMIAVKDRGGRVVRRLDYAHPFQDATPGIHRRRLEEVADFLSR
ncbi:MAG: alpha/beta fold hydrolase [Sulfuricaulis sp.]|uniref:alpha/beta hydrolase n=1 Tax=Sulfuricaulis sp. TaxID=2003553 RepID=UPI0025E1EA60|nr:alpha/beta fold hydrolase [Sulfuricaulis sp.]MCR4345637.1 alpha/beta fold hydrolase [Sulfuricaulis sp.]